MLRLILLALCSLCLLDQTARAAETWPAKPVRMVVPYSPGGLADTLGRLAAQKFSEAFGQQFVVDNKPGAGGLIASEITARSPPDGYTLVVSSMTTIVLGPIVNPKNWTLDPLKDFTHIALFGGSPTVIIVDTNMPAKTLTEFIELTKATPGGFSCGTAGIGSSGNLVAEMLQRLTGIHLTHVPYRGANQAVAEVMGHQLPTASVTVTTAAEQMRAGLVRAIAVTAKRRLPEYPEIPTFTELGYPDLVSSAWFALSGPAGLSRDIVQRLNAVVRKSFQEPDVRKRLEHDAIDFEPLTPAQFMDYIHAETTRWGPIAHDLAPPT